MTRLTDLAQNGPRMPDPMARNVSIPVKAVGGVLLTFEGQPLPALGECIGDLVVPAFAIKDEQVLEQLTKETLRQLFDKGATLMCRVGARHIPDQMLERCKIAPVPDSVLPAPFVEIVLDEPLMLRYRATKKALLERSRCHVPALQNMSAESLNEAYRRISEVFEPSRRSAGGNVFLNVYFFAEDLKAWRPLDELRGGLPFLPR